MSKILIGEIEDYGRKGEGGLSVAYGGEAKLPHGDDKLSEQSNVRLRIGKISKKRSL